MLGVKYDIKYYLLTTVLAAVFIMSVTNIVYWKHLDGINKSLLQTASINQAKTNLAFMMWNAARSRENIFQYMLIVSDPFELEELQIQYLSLASDFIKAREQLMEIEKSKECSLYLGELKKLTKTGAKMHDHIRQLVMAGHLQQARVLSRDIKLTESRKKILQKFKKIFNYYRELTNNSLQLANTTVLKDIRVVLIVSTVILFISAILGFLMIRGIKRTESDLKSEIALRIKSQKELEAHHLKLEKDISDAIEKHISNESERIISQEIAVSLGNILENSLNEIYIFDVHSLNFVQVNEGARKNLGYTMDELRQLSPLSLNPGYTEKRFRSLVKSLLDGTQEKLTFIATHKRKDGSCYPVEVHLQLSFMGYSPVFVAMILDITHRREWQEKLQNKKDEVDKVTQELAFQKIALEEHAIVCVLNKSGIIQSVNRKYVEISGFSKDELIGAHFFVGLSCSQTEEEVIEVSDVINRGDIWSGVISYLRCDGTPYWTKTTITPFFNKKAEIYKYVVVSTDITEMKKTEEKLLAKNDEIHQAHTELSFQKLALDEHAIVSTADVDGNIIYVNDKLCEISQYNREELLGSKHSVLKSDVHSDEFYRDLWCTIGDGRVWKGSLCNMKKDGSVYWVTATIVPFLNDSGKPYKYMGVSVDITSQKKNEQKLISRNKEIERTHKELKASQNMMLHAEKLASVGQLAAGIAHEINTPIQFVGDNTRFLQESFSDLFKLVSAYKELANAVNESSAFPELIGKVQTLNEEVELDYLIDEIPSAIKQSLEGVERVSKIVRSMKEFSHPGSDNLESIDLNRAIESTINVSRNEWKYVSEMVTDFDRSLELVPCYPGEFNQVVLNMIVNAAHAIEDCRNDNDELGTINISTKLVGDDVEVRISDSGCGMSDEVKQRVFEPFFTTKGVGKGTGQGLAIAYSVIVDKHKGKVNVESKQGKGTTFIIQLPLVATTDEVEIESSEKNIYRKGVA